VLFNWLTFHEVCLELRLGERAVQKLLEHRILVGYRVPVRRRDRKRFGPYGDWRILDPGAKFALYLEQRKRHIEHIPLASGREVAEIVGLTPAAIRQLKKRGRIHGKQVGNKTFYTAAEVRRFLYVRQKPSVADGRKLYSPILAHWLRELLNQDDRISGDILDRLLRQVVGTPQPLKSRFITEIWSHFDSINDLLRQVRDTKLRMEQGSESHDRCGS
jgi:hypothetical protein